MKLKQWQIAGLIFTLLFGTLLHFTYNWSGGSKIIGTFSAINESTWEHLKLLAIPMLLFSVAEFAAYGKHLPNFYPVRVFSILIGMFVIAASFYTYTGILGTNYLWADIGTFVLGTAAAYRFSYCKLSGNKMSSPAWNYISLTVLLLLVAAFAVFTFYPPSIGLFTAP